MAAVLQVRRQNYGGHQWKKNDKNANKIVYLPLGRIVFSLATGKLIFETSQRSPQFINAISHTMISQALLVTALKLASCPHTKPEFSPPTVAPASAAQQQWLGPQSEAILPLTTGPVDLCGRPAVSYTSRQLSVQHNMLLYSTPFRLILSTSSSRLSA